MTRARPFLLGLTGSIGMGKSTTAQMFADEGIPVWDADRAVHALYAPGGAAVVPVCAAFPTALQGNAVDREALKGAIAVDKSALDKLESIVHPLIAQDRADFVARHATAPLIVLDMPLLFETGADSVVDAVLVVSASPDVQRQRVLARPGMTDTQLSLMLSRQMPDAQKRAKATYLIETKSLEQTRAAVRALIEELREKNA